MSAHGKENILKSIILQQKNSPALVKGKLWKNCPLTVVLFREQKLKVTGRDTVYVCVSTPTLMQVSVHSQALMRMTW